MQNTVVSFCVAVVVSVQKTGFLKIDLDGEILVCAPYVQHNGRQKASERQVAPFCHLYASLANPNAFGSSHQSC